MIIEGLKAFMPLFNAIIAFCAFMVGLGFIFRLILEPIKAKQVHFDNELKGLKTGQAKIEVEIKDLKKSLAEILSIIKK